MSNTKIKVAFITEWHIFDVISLLDVFKSFDDVELYPQSLDIFCQDERRLEYEVVVYYNLSTPTPAPDDPRRLYFENGIGTTDQGIVLLHHGILNYPEWRLWDGITGVTDRHFSYFGNQSVRYQIGRSAPHPITNGVPDFEMVDETYQMPEPENSAAVLITAEHPRSMRTIAWTGSYQKSKVFCYQSGHDASAYTNPNFQTILHNGVRWVCGKLA
jgi:uncharacterized protein